MSELTIDLRAVHRRFGEVVALDDFDLTVRRGSVAVLLGPNGAGKTTTVRILTGSLLADAGSVSVLGVDPAVNGDAVRQRTGVVPPKPAMWDRLTGRENLEFTARIHGVAADRIQTSAARFGIDHALEQDVSGYSTGMRTRLALARALLHDPELLLLDEPTAGLDPESARAVLELIRELAGSGRTIIMATHLLHEAEGIADQVVLMGNGKVRASGPPSELAGTYMADPVVWIDGHNRDVIDQIVEHPSVVAAEWSNGFRVTLTSMDAVPDIVEVLAKDGARLTRVESSAPTLEQLYFEMQRAHGSEG
jgi:ABC-2 type transport system ATP-binding protein